VSVYIPVELRRLIRLQFKNRCAYCQTAEDLTPVTFEIEHIDPISLGGESVLENLCLACPSCNRFKSNHTFVTASEPQQTIRLFHPQRDDWSEHFLWDQDATRLIGLTEIGKSTIEQLRINRPQYVHVRRMWVAMNEHPPD
jgi:hypothetical protein